MTELKNSRHSPFPNRVLECCFNDDGDFVSEVLSNDVKEEVRYKTIGVRWQLVVLDAKGIDISFFDFIAANNWHP